MALWKVCLFGVVVKIKLKGFEEKMLRKILELKTCINKMIIMEVNLFMRLLCNCVLQEYCQDRKDTNKQTCTHH